MGVLNVARINPGQERARLDLVAGIDVQIQDLARGLGLDLDPQDGLEFARGLGGDAKIADLGGRGLEGDFRRLLGGALARRCRQQEGHCTRGHERARMARVAT